MIVTEQRLRELIADNKDVTSVDTSAITNMGWLFADNKTFNQDISGWDTSNVTSMDCMFAGSRFNQDISGWDVRKVEDMSYIFTGNKIFDQDLSKWQLDSLSFIHAICNRDYITLERIKSWGWTKQRPNLDWVEACK